MKDVASAHDLTQSQVYELAATLLVSLDENTQVKPTPSDEEVADLLDELIENFTEKREE
jgi:FMN-dependent NADH-azoreductase